MPILKPKTESKLDVVIDELLTELVDYPGYDDDYAKRVSMLEKLHDLKPPKRERVSPDTIAIVSGNIIVALLVVGYEQKNVVTSKVLGFITKLR